MNIEACLSAARDAALGAGRMLRENMDSDRRVTFKGAVDIVTDFDSRAQAMIAERISSEFPDHDYLGEEDLEREMGSEFRWLIDPIDGTTNFLHRFPLFCVSIALEFRGEIVLGVVFDPMREELFSAKRGGGAFLNNSPVRVSEVEDIGRAMLSTGFPYDIRDTKVNNLDHFFNFITRAQAIRRAGSAALDLCYVACGRFDGFWEMKLKPWDQAAASLVVTEAGGRMTDFRSGPFHVYLKQTLASNGLIHEQMVDILRLGTIPQPEPIPMR
jgi:myo-inositol-1(or 4)-monophosphatase